MGLDHTKVGRLPSPHLVNIVAIPPDRVRRPRGDWGEGPADPVPKSSEQGKSIVRSNSYLRVAGGGSGWQQRLSAPLPRGSPDPPGHHFLELLAHVVRELPAAVPVHRRDWKIVPPLPALHEIEGPQRRDRQLL